MLATGNSHCSLHVLNSGVSELPNTETEPLNNTLDKSSNMLNKTPRVQCKKGEVNQKQQLSDYKSLMSAKAKS